MQTFFLGRVCLKILFTQKIKARVAAHDVNMMSLNFISTIQLKRTILVVRQGAILIALLIGLQLVSSTHHKESYEDEFEQEITSRELSRQKRSRESIFRDEEYEYLPLCETAKKVINFASSEHYQYYPNSYVNVTCTNSQSAHYTQKCEEPGFHCVQTIHRMPIIKFRRYPSSSWNDDVVEEFLQEIYDCECKHPQKPSVDTCVSRDEF